jgi:hypothetical protein
VTEQIVFIRLRMLIFLVVDDLKSLNIRNMTKSRSVSHKIVREKESEAEVPFGTPEEESPQTQASSDNSIVEEVVKTNKKDGKKHKKKKKSHVQLSEESRSESSLIIDTWSRKYAICSDYPPK